MKYIAIISLFLMYSPTLTCFAQEQEAPPAAPLENKGPVIAWESITHDFGDINQGDRVEKIFLFTNTGNEPLIITNVSVTCGCTTPKGWPKDPIPPNDKGEITVVFNTSGKYGKQNKVIKVISNAVGDQNEVSIIANVIVNKKKK